MIIRLPRFDDATERRFLDWRANRLRELLPVPIIAGALALVAFTAWDWALDPAMVVPSLLIRGAAAALMLACAWQLKQNRTAPLRLLSGLVIVTGTLAIAGTQALVQDGFTYGSAGLALFPTVSAIAVIRAWHVPVLNLPVLAVVLVLIHLSGVDGFTAANAALFLLTGIFTATIVALALERSARYGFQLQLTLEAEARLDPLTGIPNRRQLAERAGLEVERARRFGRPLSLLLMDVDHFKRINDNHGHAVGDEVLRVLAALCRAELRQTDLLARMGGEEFVALLPETTAEGAALIAERLRLRVAAHPLLSDPVRIPVTISVGVAGWEPDTARWEDLLERADRAMYDAKEGGRNRVTHAVAAGAGSARRPAATHAA